MKNIGMKKNINEQGEGIWGESLKSLKSLKSLMQIFAESANSANSAKQIFANFVKFVKFVKPIFGTTRRPEGSVTEAEYPTNYQRISNLSLTIRPFRVAILAVLLLFVGGWSSEAWAYTNVQYTCTGYSYSIPSKTGYTWITLNGTSFNGTFSKDVRDNSKYDQSHTKLFASAPSTWDVTATMYAKPKDDYKFVGWYSNEAGTGTALSTSLNNNCYYSTTVKADKGSGNPARNFYAIFAKFKPSTYEIDFGDVAYNTGTHPEKFTIDCHNVGTWSNLSGLSGMLSASLSNNTDDNTQHTCTVTVSLNTTTAGTYNQTLKVTTSRGGTINVTVKAKVTATPSYTWNTDVWNANGTMKRDVYVGETISNIVSTPSEGTKTYSISGWNASSTINAGATTPTFTNNTLYCTQAGSLTLHIIQAAEANGFDAGSSTVNITIKKRPNTLYANTDASYHPTMRMGKDLAVTLTASNTDYANSPIQVVAQTVGDNTVAVFDYTQGTHSGTVHSKYKKDVTATWSIHQDENYMYLEGNNTFSVDVKTASENTCYVLENQSNTEKDWHGNTCHEHTWNEENVAGELKFDISKDGGLYMAYRIQQLVNGNWQQTDELEDYSTSWQTKTFTLNQAAKGVRFYFKGGSYSYVRNVSVKRKTYVDASDLTIDKTSTNNPVYPSDGVGVGTLPISYSLANGGNLKIANDNPKFTISPSVINVSDCNGGSANISIKYESSTAGTDVAHLVIYNDVYRKEVTITGITSKRNQTITWNVGNAIQVLSEIENAASVSANTEITYSTNNSAVIAIENGKLVAKGVGEATITVNAPGDDEYNAVEGSKTITVTSDLVQHIVWNQSLLGLLTGDADKTLNAYATSDVDGCTTNGGRAIIYSSSDESVVKIVNGNKLRVIGKGTAYVTASQAGGLDDDGHTYMAVIEERKAIVRDPSDPCEAYVYQQTGTATMDLGWNWLSQQDRDTEIALSAEPDQMTFRYKFEKKSDLVGVKYGGGTMYVEQKIGNNDWTKVGDDLTPSEGSYQTATVNLDRHATKVRIRAHGVGYHSFTDCQISMLRYIETSELATFEAKVGQEAAQNMTLSYSNITGPVTLILGHTPSNFSVSQTAIEGSCGDHNSVNITVTYTPIAATEEETELLRISDGVTTHDISLTGVATVTNRYISWDIPSPNSVYTVETVNLSAQALTSVGNSPAGSVFYTKGELSTTGNLSGSTLTFSNDGVAYIAAQGVADPKYNATDIITKTFNVSKTPTSISVAPTVETIVSGTAAEDVVLNTASAVSGYDVNGFSGTVPGTWSVIEEDLNTVGENRSIKIHFEPSNTDMFIGCDGYINNVTVSQREATEEEVIGVASAITYGQTAAEASTLSNDGTLAGKWEWIDERADDVLAVYTYTDMQARFTPENGNIQPKVVNVSLTVNKANPVATVNAVEITYGATASSVDLEGTGVAGTWSWTDTRKDQVLAVGEYTMNVHFKPTDLTNYNEKDATVALKVKKITTLEVDVPLSFCAGGSETFHGKTYTTAGTDQIEATGATRDTVYNVIVTVLQPTTGTDSKTIVCGASESWNGINLSGYAVGSHEVVFHTTNAAGCDSTVTLALTVVPATNIFTNAAGDGEWSEPTNWSNGVPTGDEPDVIISGDLIIDEKLTVGNLTIEKNSRVVLTVNGDLTVNGASEDRTEYGNLYVQNGGEVEINGGLRVGDLTVEASIGTSDGTAESGQVDKAENIVYANAYIEINMDARGTLDDTKWYGFTVPFDVDAHAGISRKEDGVYRQCTYGTHYMIAEYDANKRLNTGKGWKYITGNTLHAGTFYYLTVDGNYNTYRFKAKEATYTQASPATLAMNGPTSNPNANWNAVGNSTLQHAKVSFEGGNYVQVYENGLDAYRTVSASEATFVVGCPFFIQAEEESTLVLDVPTSATDLYYAPRRLSAAQDGVARVNLTSVEGGYSDQIYISGTDKEEDAYIAGRDLAKAGESRVVPQLWVDAYNQKLSVHEAAWQGENAICPLGIYVPEEGEYTLTATQPEDGTQVYLTIDGMPVWNISETAYILSLGKGTMNNYGLMLLQASRMPTGVENVESADDEKAQKIILNNQLYILRDSRMYDVTGKKVK